MSIQSLVLMMSICFGRSEDIHSVERAMRVLERTNCKEIPVEDSIHDPSGVVRVQSYAVRVNKRYIDIPKSIEYCLAEIKVANLPCRNWRYHRVLEASREHVTHVDDVITLFGQAGMSLKLKEC